MGFESSKQCSVSILIFISNLVLKWWMFLACPTSLSNSFLHRSRCRAEPWAGHGGGRAERASPSPTLQWWGLSALPARLWSCGRWPQNGGVCVGIIADWKGSGHKDGQSCPQSKYWRDHCVSVIVSRCTLLLFFLLSCLRGCYVDLMAFFTLIYHILSI